MLSPTWKFVRTFRLSFSNYKTTLRSNVTLTLLLTPHRLAPHAPIPHSSSNRGSRRVALKVFRLVLVEDAQLCKPTGVHLHTCTDTGSGPRPHRRELHSRGCRNAHKHLSPCIRISSILNISRHGGRLRHAPLPTHGPVCTGNSHPGPGTAPPAPPHGRRVPARPAGSSKPR